MRRCEKQITNQSVRTRVIVIAAPMKFSALSSVIA